jgi:hypothetical protein
VVPGALVSAATSLLPLDVGFDLRRHDYRIDLGEHVQGGRLAVRYLDRDDRERVAVGTVAEVTTALAAAGYRLAEVAP